MTIPEPFASRIARLRALLDESEAELLLADHGELMAWITGYTVSETMYRAVLVGRDAPPWMVLRELDAPQVGGQGWLADVEGFADRHDPFAAVAASIRRRGFAPARIVVDSASYSFTVDAQARLRASDFSHTFLPTSDWPLKAGMVFHMYTSAEGIGISETVLVTANGGERLTRTPRRLLASRARDGAPGTHLAGIGESRPGARDGQRVTGEE